jgi:hypothetical protein
MRCLQKNKQKLYYALYTGKEQFVDDHGNKTGQYRVTYSSPVEMLANISPARGASDVDMFGITETYSKTIVTDDLSCPIDEKSVLWIGKEPVFEGEPVPYNYVVVRKAKSLNSITYAVLEVEASA